MVVFITAKATPKTLRMKAPTVSKKGEGAGSYVEDEERPD